MVDPVDEIPCAPARTGYVTELDSDDEAVVETYHQVVLDDTGEHVVGDQEIDDHNKEDSYCGLSVMEYYSGGLVCRKANENPSG